MSASQYIRSPWYDALFVLAPPFVLTTLFVLVGEENLPQDVSPLMWLALVVAVDVAHVYSTLFQTYLNPSMRRRFKTALVATPLVALVASALLYSCGSKVFWTCMAYLAVFHFIRQQYGFMRLYSRNENSSSLQRMAESWIIHYVAFFPIIYWHLHQREFHWFVEGDFFYFGEHPLFLKMCWGLYAFILALWVGLMLKDLASGTFRWPKHALIAGTALSWYMGIVHFNGDLTFTALNVICHGVPYMALVWSVQRHNSEDAFLVKWKKVGLPLFIGILLFLGIAEETLWDVFHWREHDSIFGALYSIPAVTQRDLQALVVALLSVPQITHYLLDGVIWKRRTGAASASDE